MHEHLHPEGGVMTAQPWHDEALKLCLGGGAEGFDVKRNFSEQKPRAADYIVFVARQILSERQADQTPPADQPKATIGAPEPPTGQPPDIPDAESTVRSQRRRRRK